jgi:hypothetical protein
MDKTKTIKEFLQPYLEVVTYDHVILGDVSTVKMKDGWKLSVVDKSDFESPEFDGCMWTVSYVDDTDFGRYRFDSGYLDCEPMDMPYMFVLSERVVNGWMITKTLDLYTLESKDVSIFNCDINGVSNK